MKSLLVKNNLVLLAALLLSLGQIFAQLPAKMRRVCRPGVNNSLYFFPSQDTCSAFKKYYLWGRNGSIGPYVLLDSITNKAADSYTHINANPSGNPTNWSYFIEYSDSCYLLSAFSDTMSVDETPPDTLFLDSVSVDIITNKVSIGWRKNQSPDFYRYLLYYDSLGIKWVEVTNTILRDTFLTDNNTFSDPRLRPLKYDITSKDSCDTRAQVFNINPHSTIYLSGAIDTCKKVASLTWTHYIGWAKVRRYYIYKRVNGLAYVLIDSIDGSINKYDNPIILGDVNDYFVRAFKDTSIIVSSTSSLLTLQSRSRNDPNNTLLVNVTAVDPDDDKLEIAALIKTGEESRFINYLFSNSANPAIFNSITSQNTLGSSGLQKVVLISPDKADILLYKLESADLCNNKIPNAVIMPQLNVTATANGDNNTLLWNKHFGWDSGVEKYRIYRGTNDDSGIRTYFLIDSVSGSDSVYTDINLPDRIGSFGLCYYIEAIQNSGSPSGFQSAARGFSKCLIGELIVFVPNAFHPEGVNKFFRPEGSYIDYVNSSLEIFDRWGNRVIAIKDITNGWDGKDSSGNMRSGGVYYYKLNLISPNGQKQTKTGFVTLLN